MVKALTTIMMVDSVCIVPPYRTRSQKCTYPSDNTKKAIVIATNMTSCMFISYVEWAATAPVCSHHTTPAVAVSHSLEKTYCSLVRKHGRTRRLRSLPMGGERY
jgi:hypothetical protein